MLSGDNEYGRQKQDNLKGPGESIDMLNQRTENPLQMLSFYGYFHSTALVP
jgi:hypothetical protein